MAIATMLGWLYQEICVFHLNRINGLEKLVIRHTRLIAPVFFTDYFRQHRARQNHVVKRF